MTEDNINCFVANFPKNKKSNAPAITRFTVEAADFHTAPISRKINPAKRPSNAKIMAERIAKKVKFSKTLYSICHFAEMTPSK